MSGSGYGPAVLDGKLLYTSPSAMSTWSTCARKYFFKYVLGLKEDEPSNAMRFGIAAHKRIEQYLTTGIDILGPCEREGLEYMPAPKTEGMLVEQKTGEGAPLLCADVPVKGSMDLVRPFNEAWQVTDWKFTSKLSNKRNVTARSLINPDDDEGRQVLMYARWVKENFAAKAFLLRHVHFQMGSVDEQLNASGPFAAKEVETSEIPARVVDDGFFHIEACVERIKSTAGIKRVEGIPLPAEGKDLEEVCWKYHKPCAYLRQCPGGGRGESAIGKLFGSSRAPVPVSTGGSMSLMNTLKTVSQTPTPAPVPPTAVSATPAPEVDIRIAAYPNVSTALPTSFTDEKTGETKPIKGALLTAGVEKTLHTTSSSTAAPDPVLRLYFNAVPPLPNLYEYMIGLEAKALEAFKETVPDIRLSSSKGLAFGQWKAVLGQLAKESPPPPGNYVVITGDDDRVDAVASALAAAYPNGVVRGSR